MSTEPYSLLWGESKYSLDDQSESHSGYIYIYINSIDIIPDEISTSVPTYIYISTYDDSVDPLDPVNSSESFVTENLNPSFDRYNLLAEYFKIRRIISKSLDTTTNSTNKYHHNSDTRSAKLDTDAKFSCINLKYILHNYKPYTSNF